MKTMMEIGKLITMVLRHRPEYLDIQLDEHGWADVSTLIERINAIQPFDMAMLEKIVRTSNKQRYAFNEDKTKIRANQGHSIPVDLQLTPKRPPSILWHGTGIKNVEGIWEKGLLPNGRQYVHLSADTETAAKVGSRHGKPVIFVVDAEAMAKDGLRFFQSENGVWLTDNVPRKYLQCEVAWASPEWFDGLREKAKEMRSAIYIAPNATDGWRWVRALNTDFLQYEDDDNGISLVGKSVFFLGDQDEYWFFCDGKRFYKTYVPQDWDSSFDRIRWECFKSFEELILKYSYCPYQEVPSNMVPRVLMSIIRNRVPTFADCLYVYAKKLESNIRVSFEAIYEMKEGCPNGVKELRLAKYVDSECVMKRTMICGTKDEVFKWLENKENQHIVVALVAEMMED